jgi:hypothetical protein
MAATVKRNPVTKTATRNRNGILASEDGKDDRIAFVSGSTAIMELRATNLGSGRVSDDSRKHYANFTARL